MRASILLVTILIAAACAAQPSPSTAISAEAAKATAIQQVGSLSTAKVLSTRLSTYGAEAGGGQVVDGSTPVWAVLLSGTFGPPSCGPISATPHPCPSPATTALVLIDARTGAFIQAAMPAPSPS